jgi:uncharacterized membrane protein
MATMSRSTRRLILLVLGLIAFVVVTALVYQIGMARLEGKPRCSGTPSRGRARR